MTVPVLAFDGYDGHTGQIPLCRNNKTGAIKFAPIKDIDPTTGVNYEPYSNTKPPFGSTIPTEEMVWINVQGPVGPQGAVGPIGPIGPQGIQGVAGPKGDSGSRYGDYTNRYDWRGSFRTWRMGRWTLS